MQWDFVVGLIIGGAVSSLICFSATWTIAARTYRCVPCAHGRPISLTD